jgi:hypothetical protein
MIFSIADGRESLFQWDTGRKLNITEPEGVQFANVRYKWPLGGTKPIEIDRTETATTVKVPDEILMNMGTLVVWPILIDTDGVETYAGPETFTIEAQPKPSDYAYTPTEVRNYESLKALIPLNVSQLNNDVGYLTRCIIEAIKVNGLIINPVDRTVSITIPTDLGDFTNNANYAKKDANNNFSAAQTVNGTLTVNGDIVQNGESYVTHTEDVNVTSALFTLRADAVGGMTETEISGLKVPKYNGVDDLYLVVGADGMAKVGKAGELQDLLTRIAASLLQDGQLLYWDAATKQAKGTSDYATKSYVNNLYPIKISQTDYNALVAAGTVQTDRDYIIVG